MANTALEQLKKLDEQRAKLLEEATDEAKKRAEDAIADLNALGYNYRLTADGKPTKKRAASSKTKHCSICNIDGHDVRNHRNQEPQKKFTKKELEERGLPQAE